tara:strand:+ start:1710 stop:1985 length:276 start_codon:yes stop_codon:yes gene_type:complete
MSNNNIDKRLKKVFQNINEYKIKQKNMQFNKWLNTNTNQYIKRNDILNKFCEEIIYIIKKKGFSINNEKLLRNEIASFIYNISEDAKKDYV